MSDSVSAAKDHHLRQSLKRGFAREAANRAGRSEADHAAIFHMLRQAAPNRRSIDRTVLRLRGMPGVVRAGVSDDRVLVILRNRCTLTTRAGGVDAFSEDALLYSRVSVGISKRGMNSMINRASFSLHALERLIERSQCPISDAFHAAVDAEAVNLLRQLAHGSILKHTDDSFVRARHPGVWAGSLDVSHP
jgi:hypothetical protein